MQVPCCFEGSHVEILGSCLEFSSASETVCNGVISNQTDLCTWPMAEYRELYNGETFDDLPQQVLTFSTSPCGRLAYMLGERTQFSIDNRMDLIILTESSIFEYDIRSGKRSSFVLDVEIPKNHKVLDFYMLDECHRGVLMLYCKETQSIVQHLLKFDRVRKVTDCFFTRTTKFAGMSCTRVGLGASQNGYIVVTGNMEVDQGFALVGIIIAADPSQSHRIRNVSLDRELGEMERKLKDIGDDLFVWPRAIPMVTAKGVYFPVCQLRDTNNIDYLNFYPNILAAIEFKDSTLVAKIEEIPLFNRSVLQEEYNIEDANMMVQRGPCAWLSFIQPGPIDDWRWIVQYWAVYGCVILLRYVGGFALWFSRFDRGRLAILFTRFYTWLLGPNLLPNFGPEPSFHAFALNMNNWKFAKIDYKTDNYELKNNAQILIDVNTKGNATFFEINRKRRSRFGFYSNPFFPRSLFDLALAKAEIVNPALRTDLAVMKEYGVGHLNRLL